MSEQYNATLASSGATTYATNAQQKTTLYALIAATQVIPTQTAQILHSAQIAKGLIRRQLASAPHTTQQ